MPVIREPERYLAVPLTKRQCEAVRRAIAGTMRESREAAGDHELLVQSLGSLSVAVKDEDDRIKAEKEV